MRDLSGNTVRADFDYGTLVVDISGAVRESNLLRARAQKLGDMRPAFRSMLWRFSRIQADWFDTEGRGSWKDLSKGTVDDRTVRHRIRRDGSEYVGGRAYYARHGDQGPKHLILQWTGEMRQDFISHLAPHSVAEIRNTSLLYGSERDRAVENHPTRPVLDKDNLQEAAYLDIRRYVESTLAGQPFHSAQGMF